MNTSMMTPEHVMVVPPSNRNLLSLVDSSDNWLQSEEEHLCVLN